MKLNPSKFVLSFNAIAKFKTGPHVITLIKVIAKLLMDHRGCGILMHRRLYQTSCNIC